MLRRNVIYNLVGALGVSLIAVIVIPPYLRIIGAERFGVLALIWLIFGYFGLFDFGLSRATANSLAKIGDERSKPFADTFWTSLLLNAILGLIGSVVFVASAPLIIATIHISDPRIAAEVERSLPWVATLIPLATTGGVFTGVLEATQRFLTLNLLQIFGSALFQPLPLLAVLLFGVDVKVAIVASVVARFISVAASAWYAVRVISLDHEIRPSREISKTLLRYGGWVSVTNIVGPILVSIDQFMIGSMLGAAAVAYYVVPFNLAMRALVLPAAVTRALFPKTSGLSEADALSLSKQAVRTVAFLMALMVAPAILLCAPALTMWVGQDFSDHAAPTARLLLLATWINGITYIPFSQLQSQGRPDLVAKFHALEIGPFLILLWILIHTLGLPGAALAWAVRVSADAILQFGAAGYYKGGELKVIVPPALALLAAFGLASLVALAFPVQLLLATLFFSCLLILQLISDPNAAATATGLLAKIRKLRTGIVF